MAKAYKCSNCGEVLVLGESLFGTRFKVLYLSLRRDDIYDKEFISVKKLGPCKMTPDRNKWIISAYVNGGNLHAVINYCPMCGRKLESKNEVNNG